MKSLKLFIHNLLGESFIMEMAISRRAFIDYCKDRFDQIIENWCIIKYCNLYDEENCNRLHWSGELMAHLKKINDYEIKGGINKKKAIQQAVEEVELYNIDNIIETCKEKWKNEKLPQQNIKEIAKEFTKSANIIIDLVSKKNNLGNIKKYVYNSI